jgi:propanol-preferring alcohol dehydrogenase
MVISRISDVRKNREPLDAVELAEPSPASDEIRIRVLACGVCHTELDEIEGRTPPSRFPRVPGHQVVGVVDDRGAQATRFSLGERVGVAWIYRACGQCEACRRENENLCETFEATGRDADGGYAEYMTVPESFAYAIPGVLSSAATAPLLCAGAIGYRSLKLSGIANGRSLGLTGFGASAHLVLQLVRHRFPDTRVYVFARSPGEREFARELGACWAGDTDASPPERLDAVIDTTPAWKPVIRALENLKGAGRLVVNAIRKEDADRDYLHRLDYPSHLWLEKEIKSVANVQRSDVENMLQIAAEMSLQPTVQRYALEEANQALCELKDKKIRGAKVLVFDE